MDAASAPPSPGDGYSAAQVQAAERPLIDAGEPLMQRAALSLADVVSGLLRSTDAAGRRRGPRPVVLVLAGSGDNGGDALYAAAHLAERGADVRVVAVGSRVHEAAAAAARAAGALDVAPPMSGDPAASAAPGAGADAAFDDAVQATDVVVDGILGIGAAASPALRGTARDAVARIRALLGRSWTDRTGVGARHPLVVAVDLPSGVSPDDGSVPVPVVLPADVTVTMGAVKAGLLVGPAAPLAGRIVLVDLGLGPALADVRPVVRDGSRHRPS
ncbi:NAD(P)H-hydrate epimerase [Agromyces sp. NPDC058110]|uniref:NAD(P)H-hydrate epimerase n=1 Tax=Agromyces sp. NPDC058110 TaxID=3346345 RepID=UPI0036DD5538